MLQCYTLALKLIDRSISFSATLDADHKYPPTFPSGERRATSPGQPCGDTVQNWTRRASGSQKPPAIDQMPEVTEIPQRGEGASARFLIQNVHLSKFCQRPVTKSRLSSFQRFSLLCHLYSLWKLNPLYFSLSLRLATGQK